MERICNRKAVSTGLLLLVICLLAYGCLWESSSGEDAFSRAMNQALQDSVPRHQIPGVAAAVRKPDGTIWRGAAGLADIEAGTPVHADMYFHIGSITKCFTATLFLQLVDKGWATLDDTLDKWLPGMVSNGSQITIRNLLQMRSGLDHYENDTTFVNFFLSDPRYVWSFSELLATCNRTLFNPNTQYDYNNMNYIIVGEIIKTILGQTYAQAIQERILDPLGMTNTSVPTTASMPEPYAHGYLYENGRVVDHSTTWDTSALGAAGSMISTVSDLLIWIEALMDGTLLTQAMYAEQFNFLPAGSGTGYGIGVGVMPDGMVGHAGD